MDRIDTIRSKIDKTVKFVFRLDDGSIAEVSHIDKEDGKDILCVPSQTCCNLGCRFCHTSNASGVKVRGLTYNEIYKMVDAVCFGYSLPQPGNILLVSYMGCGEPMMNELEVYTSMMAITDKKTYNCRFAIATLLPKDKWRDFFDFTWAVKRYKLKCKVHLSLHFTEDEIRNEWMPAALDIAPSLDALCFYRNITGNSIEVHYALIENVNDDTEDAHYLALMVKSNTRNIPVKLIKYNTKDDQYKPSSDKRLDDFVSVLQMHNVQHEYYEPPGHDVGASCGEFLMDYYLKYAPKNGEQS